MSGIVGAGSAAGEDTFSGIDGGDGIDSMRSLGGTGSAGPGVLAVVLDGVTAEEGVVVGAQWELPGAVARGNQGRALGFSLYPAPYAGMLAGRRFRFE